MKKKRFLLIFQLLVLIAYIATFIATEINVFSIKGVLKDNSVEGLSLIALLPVLIISLTVLLLIFFISFIIYLANKKENAIFSKISILITFVLMLIAFISSGIVIFLR